MGIRLVRARRPWFVAILIVTVLATALMSTGSLAVARDVEPSAEAPSIVGVIHDWPSESPIAGIIVRVVSADEEDLQHPAGTTYAVVTGADGSFTISGLPAEGWYHVTFIDTTDVYRDQHWGGQGVPIESAFPMFAGEGVNDLGTQHMLKVTEVNSHRVTRVSGDDRYQTAIKMADKFGSAETVVLASGEGFPDALAAAPLAGAYDAPILLTPSNALPSGLTSCLTRLGASKVIVVGGAAAVSYAISSQLDNLGYDVVRYAGQNRYDTARILAIETALKTGASGERIPFIVRGDEFADALAVAPFAWLEGRPILLTEPHYCPHETSEAFNWLMQTEDDCATYIVGGEGAVGEEVLAYLWETVAQPDPLYYLRIAGSNRYDTAAACVTDYWGRDVDFYGLASGTSFPDALSAGPVVGGHFGALLLTDPSRLSSETRSQLVSDKQYIWDVIVAGGTSAVSSPVADSAAAAIVTTYYDMDSYSGGTPGSISLGEPAAVTTGDVAEEPTPTPQWAETGALELQAYTGPATR